MPYRKTPIIVNEIYHVFNRGVAKQNIYSRQQDYQRFLNLLAYYRHLNEPVQYAQFTRLDRELKTGILKRLKDESEHRVKIIAFCLMPNHFHILVEPLVPSGLTKFIQKVCNSYGHYYNLKYDRVGSFFQGPFKAVHITSDEQLLHVSRYIHLNPYSSDLVSNLNQLYQYPHSSLPQYLDQSTPFTFAEPSTILAFFKPPHTYKKFITDQADYQQSLELYRHLYLD